MINATSEVLADDERVIATKWTMHPGSETGHHVHRHDYVVVYLTDGLLTVGVRASGAEAGVVNPENANPEEIEAQVMKHQLTSRPAGVSHNVMNRTEEPVEFIEIELK